MARLRMSAVAQCALALMLVLSVGQAGAQQALSGGSVIRGTFTDGDARVSPGGRGDEFPLRGRAGQRFRITLTGEPPLDPLLVVRGENSFWRTNDDADGFNSSLTFTLPRDGDYTVIATTFEGSGRGDYTMRVTALAAAPTITLGQTLSGELAAEDDTGDHDRPWDSYLLRVDRAQSVVITLRATAFDPLLKIYTPTFSTDNDDAEGLNSRLELDLQPGLHQIVVASVAEEMLGPYQLSVTRGRLAPMAQAPAPRPTTQQAAAPQQSRPAPANRTVVANFDGVLRSSTSVHTAQLNAGQHVHVLLTSDVFDTHLAVAGPGGFEAENNNQYGEMFGAPRNYAGDIQDSGMYLSAPATGAYRFTVSNNEDDEPSGAYTLSVTQLPVLTVGRDIAGELTTRDVKNDAGSFVHSYSYPGRAGERLNLRYTSDDYSPRILVYPPEGYAESGEGSLNVTLPVTGTYRVDVTTFRSGDIGSYLLQSSHGEIAARPQARPVEARLPNDCAGALAELTQRRARLGGQRGGQFTEITGQIARAHLCLDDLAAADRAYAEIVAADSVGSPDWSRAMLSRVALAELRGAYAEAETLRRPLVRAQGFGQMQAQTRLEQYGRATYAIDAVDNIELLEFASMIEVARNQPAVGARLLAARQQTIANAGRQALSERMVTILTRFVSQGLGDADCNTLTHVGISFSTGGQARSAVELLQRALVKGREYTVVENEFRCGNKVDGSGDIVEQEDVVVALAVAHVFAGDSDAGIAVLSAWVQRADSQVAAAQLGQLYEVKGDRTAALAAWRDAMRRGANRYADYEGGSIHDVAGEAFLRLGAPADAQRAYEGIGRIVDETTEEPYREDVAPMLADLYASALLSERLASGDVSAPLACASGNTTLDISRYGQRTPARVDYDNRAYFEYCRAWIAQAGGSADASRTSSALLAHARRRGWGDGEVRALVEQNLEAAWASSQ